MHNRKRLPIIVAIAAIAFITLASCSITVSASEDGDVYGYYRIPSGTTADYLSLGGFPSGTTSPYMNYKVWPGTYKCAYVLFDGFRYWPGNAFGTGGFDSSYYWKSTYTVKANSGSFSGKGESKVFGLYLSKSGGLQRDTGDVSISSLPSYSAASSASMTELSSDERSLSITNEILQR